MRVLYATEATAHRGRDGHVRSSDGILDLDLRVPVELGGRGEPATNPDARITARVTLNITDDKRYLLGAELRGNIAGVSGDEARALMRAAHQICPYSNSMRGNVDVRLLLETDAVPDALASSSH
jgi:osmotically inducible protein OsmC